MADAGTINIIDLTAEVVGAHVANNNVAASDLPNLIKTVYDALTGLGQEAAAPAEQQAPAVSIRASVKPDYIVCLEDGTKVKLLKRYLASRYDLTPDQYRQKWGLPADYPMVAPNYAERRRELATASGLGRKAVEKVEEVATAIATPIRARVRKTAEELAEILGGSPDKKVPPTRKGKAVAAEADEAASAPETPAKPRRTLKLKTV